MSEFGTYFETPFKQMLSGLWTAAWMELAKASVVEPDPDAQRSILESITACIEVPAKICTTQTEGNSSLDAVPQETSAAQVCGD